MAPFSKCNGGHTHGKTPAVNACWKTSSRSVLSTNSREIEVIATVFSCLQILLIWTDNRLINLIKLEYLATTWPHLLWCAAPGCFWPVCIISVGSSWSFTWCQHTSSPFCSCVALGVTLSFYWTVNFVADAGRMEWRAFDQEKCWGRGTEHRGRKLGVDTLLMSANMAVDFRGEPNSQDLSVQMFFLLTQSHKSP